LDIGSADTLMETLRTSHERLANLTTNGNGDVEQHNGQQKQQVSEAEH
jgi:hypothetical protein